MKIGSVGMMIVIVGSVQVARAGEPWGTEEEASVCDKEYSANKNLKEFMVINDAINAGKISEPCKAEIEKRATQCVADPEMQKIIKDPAYKIKDGEAWCKYRAFWNMGNQLDKIIEKREKAAADAKAAEAKKAELAGVELPKAQMKDAGLEKAVAAAYRKAGYRGTVLRVILAGWNPDLEKDAFGHVTGRDLAATVVTKQPDGKCLLHTELWLQRGSGRSFSGALSARGAGSEEESEILCSKATGARK